MTSQTAINVTNPELTILSLTPLEDDHVSLEAIVRDLKYRILKATHIAGARDLLRRHEVPVVVCEQELAPGKWTDLLPHIQDLPTPPSLIVTSRLADEHLWAEALNIGAWDVLAKPFDPSEVLRSLWAASRHWQNEFRNRIKTAIRVAS
jgi:DNA-binding NtrC family response regulator